ncbi:MAG: hypothetical protein J3K34DRAFT_421264 [Monoraphidium minutum]|nr:MAG: hypothetical protein J3K34DRAFT_421264 [Monoraphidium minutum]
MSDASGIANPFGRKLLAVALKGGKQGVCGAFNFVGAAAFLSALLFGLSTLLAVYDLNQGKGIVGADGEIHLPVSAPAKKAPSPPASEISASDVAAAKAVAAQFKADSAASGSPIKAGREDGGDAKDAAPQVTAINLTAAPAAPGAAAEPAPGQH